MRRCALLGFSFPLVLAWSACTGSSGSVPGSESTPTVSPILISLEAHGAYELTSVRDGVMFDIDADGVPEEVAWTKAGSQVAFLARDRNGDGQITSGKELFGNFTYPGVRNGFDALIKAARDSKGSHGAISSDDVLFAELLLWTDTDHNGISQPWELRPASTVLAAIGLGYAPSDKTDAFGNRFGFRGWVSKRTAPGRNEATSAKEDKERRIDIWDVYLRVDR